MRLKINALRVFKFLNCLKERGAELVCRLKRRMEQARKKNLKTEIDPEKIEAFRGTIFLSFARGENNKIAVKIIDDRDIES